MHIGDIDFYRDFFYNRAGLIISQEKSFLLDSRLTPIARKWGYANLKAMTLALRGIPKSELVDEVLDAIMSPETPHFFHGAFFHDFQKMILPLLTNGKARGKLNIWCAGCATGQEPYSLAMSLRQLQKNKLRGGWSAEILATDVNSIAIDKARHGIYSQFEVQFGLPIDILTQYFAPHGDQWQVMPEIAWMVTFETFNLLDNVHGMGSYDLILCRDVLNQFDAKMRAKALGGLAKCLNPKGLLVLGEEENINDLPETLKPVAGCSWLYAGPEGPESLPAT